MTDILKNSPKLKELRNIKRKNFQQCLSCGDIDYCRMCLMKNAVEDPDGDYLKISGYFCKMAKLKHSIVKQQITEDMKNAI